MPHEQAGGLSTKCEEKVAMLPLPPLAHKNGLKPRVQRLFWYGDPWSLFFSIRDLWSLFYVTRFLEAEPPYTCVAYLLCNLFTTE